jgi:hypothetical protein
MMETNQQHRTPGGPRGARLQSRAGGATLAALALASAFALAACTASGRHQAGRAEPQADSRPVAVDEGSDLPDLARAVDTPEDSLVLDLLLGYRMLVLANPEAANLDKETLNRSRKAFEKLENALRHGGIRPRDPGERVFSITNEEKLSLQEVLRSASASAGKAARAGDWERARSRWREIVQSKAAVAWVMEEATWGLALADALESSLPEPIKNKLRAVDESYAREIGQDEIARQVKDLLAETIPDERLRRELKKLANRAWERDKLAGRLTAAPASQPVPAAGPDTGAKAGDDELPPPTAVAGMLPPPAEPAAQPITPPPVSTEALQGMAQVDTLIAQGKYLAALRAMEGTPGADPQWAKERRARIGDRYCEEKRKAAANGFMSYKKAGNDRDRGLHLRRTAADLDSCLFHFPDISVSQKVRRNREMVEGELKKLKQ